MASLLSVGTQLGSQFWVGTVAGPTMFVNLERPTFGFIQSKLFPKYGLIGTATSVIALGGHYFGHRSKITNLHNLRVTFDVIVTLVHQVQIVSLHHRSFIG